MLDHFHAGDKIELAKAQRAQLARNVANIEACALGMKRGNSSIFRRGVHACHFAAHARQRFAQQACAAAHIQRGLAGQRLHALHIARPMHVYRIADKAEPHRIEPVQHGGGTLRIPPIPRQLSEMRGLFRADGGRSGFRCDSCSGIMLTPNSARGIQPYR